MITVVEGDRAKARKIGLHTIRDLPQNTETFDAGPGSVPAFGARRRAGASVSYFVMYRAAGRLRRFTIGRHGAPWTPDTARKKALEVLSDVKIGGGDPAAEKRTRREAATMLDLCDLYWEDAEAGRVMTRQRSAKKASTLLSDKGRIEKHIKPLLGRLKVAAVTAADVRNFMYAVSEGKTASKEATGKKRGVSNVRGGAGVATRTVGLLGGIFSYAIDRGMRAENPVRGVQRPADGTRKRRLSDDEYAALGEALRLAEAERIWPAALAAIRFLALTGWRSGEALGLRWAEVDLTRRTATLSDTKTGKSMRPLSNAACDVLGGLSRSGELIFPPTRGNGQMGGFRSLFDRTAALGGLPVAGRAMAPIPQGARTKDTKRSKVITRPGATADLITPHALRHSFASLAADIGYSEPTIAALIGHKGQTITSRYIHSADAVLLAAADAVATETAARMGEAKTPGKLVNLRAG